MTSIPAKMSAHTMGKAARPVEGSPNACADAALDTIFALASGAGRAAIAVVRLSGSRASSILDHLCPPRPLPRVARLRHLHDSAGAILDHGVVLWLPGPGSYTGEDCAELHLHGGPAVIASVADALVSLGARPAYPGEFTLRAFHAGKLDLLEAEAVGDLIDAETDGQRRQALRQLEGELSQLYAGWSARLRSLLARQEALIDFPDEDIPDETDADLRRELDALGAAMRTHLDDGGRGEKVRDGLVFVVAGAPNVGKSSLVNALAGRDVAIVSRHAGTTRDALEVRIVLGGVPVTLTDTAGLRAAGDEIEAEGVRRAEQRARAADLLVAVGVAGEPEFSLPSAIDAHLPVLRLANKADLGGRTADGAIPVSALTGDGVGAVRAALAEKAHALTTAAGPPPLTRARHRAALRRALSHIDDASAIDAPELRGEDLRMAMRSLGTITGAVGVEDILETIFSTFCIGK